LSVFSLYFREARRETYLVLSWVVFAVSLCFNYLLAEAGERFYHANFTWGAQAALLILFIASARFWVMQVRQPSQPVGAGERPWRTWLIGGILALHVISGLVWFSTQLAFGQPNWW